MHEIPISSAHPVESLPYPRAQWYYSSGPPGGLAREGSKESVVSWLWDSVATAGGQFQQPRLLPNHIITGILGEEQTCVCPPSLTRDS